MKIKLLAGALAILINLAFLAAIDGELHWKLKPAAPAKMKEASCVVDADGWRRCDLR